MLPPADIGINGVEAPANWSKDFDTYTHDQHGSYCMQRIHRIYCNSNHNIVHSWHCIAFDTLIEPHNVGVFRPMEALFRKGSQRNGVPGLYLSGKDDQPHRMSKIIFLVWTAPHTLTKVRRESRGDHWHVYRTL